MRREAVEDFTGARSAYDRALEVNPNLTFASNILYFTHIARNTELFWTGIALVNIEFNVSVSVLAWTGIIQGIGCGVLWVPLTIATFKYIRKAS